MRQRGKGAGKRLSLHPRMVDLIVYDFDGVLTDNTVFVFDDGREAVICNRSDGLAVQKIRKLGIPQIILSAEKNAVVRARARKLKIISICGVDDKKSALIQYCHGKKYSLARTLYLGNDINDIDAMKAVGFSIAPQDAHKKVKAIATIVIPVKGGAGVVRELVSRYAPVRPAAVNGRGG